ncbi:hypothetical protein [Aliarcobacter butzleri]|uniref:hypothetical protein n=1 Tax=Aliarcobacter butzleri TaxID=28197 RepID=UPI00125F94CC|nr:hypothetical protein [Aliarcobacter butzleri]
MNKMIVNLLIGLFKMREVWILLIFLCLFIVITILLNYIDNSSIILSVLSSIIASILILFCYRFFDGKDRINTKIFKKFGIKDLYSKKTDAVDDFTDCIKNAKKRVWAIGMTNGAFIREQKDNIANTLERNDGLDVKIVYWDDCTKVIKRDNNKSIIDIQKALESQLSINCLNDISDSNSIQTIQGSIVQLKAKISVEHQERVEIGFLSIPSSFSCLLIDNDLYFFPFLCGKESNISPMIRCHAKKDIGQPIVKHFEHIFEQKGIYTKIKLNSSNFDCRDN